MQKKLPSRQINKSEKDISKLKLEGYSINNKKLLEMFDASCNKSVMIKGMSITKKGFSKKAKVLSEENINKISMIVEKKIDEAIVEIENANFIINPKRFDNDLVGCEFCKYNDLCFRKEEDIINLKNMKLEDIFNQTNI